MAETKFLIKYTIKNDSLEEFFKIIKELKLIISGEGLIDYSVYVDKKDQFTFTEIYTFENFESYNNYDDEADERVNILMSKLSDIVVDKTTTYSVINKLEFDENE